MPLSGVPRVLCGGGEVQGVHVSRPSLVARCRGIGGAGAAAPSSGARARLDKLEIPSLY